MRTLKQVAWPPLLPARFVSATMLCLGMGLSACGGGGADASGDTSASSNTQAVPAAVAAVQSLMTHSSDDADPVDVGAMDMATDDSAEPASVLIE